MYAARKQEILRLQSGLGNPRQHRLPSWFGDFKLDRAPCLLLKHERTHCHYLAVADIAHSQLHQITSSKLAVDRQIEQSQIPAPPSDLQAYADCPNLLELERRLLADQLALFQGSRVILAGFTDSMTGAPRVVGPLVCA